MKVRNTNPARLSFSRTEMSLFSEECRIIMTSRKTDPYDAS